MKGKCIIAVCGDEAGREGAVHSIKQMWNDHAEEDGWGILLVDARNAFNKVNRRAMLWNVRHSWASGAQFAFNTYRHWRKLVLCGHKDLAFSKEGVTQGDPLAMI
eukprot:1297488-Ditylum_brightwellii.AAC.1